MYICSKQADTLLVLFFIGFQKANLWCIEKNIFNYFLEWIC